VAGGGKTVLGSQVSAIGYLVQVLRFRYRSQACHPNPHLYPNLIPRPVT
jgi:hypothetical protein